MDPELLAQAVTKLEVVDIRFKCLSTKHVSAICSAMRESSPLKRLNLSQNNLSLVGAWDAHWVKGPNEYFTKAQFEPGSRARSLLLSPPDATEHKDCIRNCISSHYIRHCNTVV